MTIDGLDEEELERRNIVSGEYTLKVDGGEFEDGYLKIPPNAQLDFEAALHRGPHHTNRHLMPTNEYTLLVVHIRANDTMGTANPAQLSDDVFGTGLLGPDHINLKEHMANCSYNHITITPATGQNITGGVTSVEISSNADGTNRGTL